MHPDFSAAKMEKKSAQITRAYTVAVHSCGNTSIWTIASLAALLKTERCVVFSCRDSTVAHRWVSSVYIGLLSRLCVWCAVVCCLDIDCVSQSYQKRCFVICGKLCCQIQPVSRYDGSVTAYCRRKTRKIALREQRTQNTH